MDLNNIVSKDFKLANFIQPLFVTFFIVTFSLVGGYMYGDFSVDDFSSKVIQFSNFVNSDYELIDFALPIFLIAIICLTINLSYKLCNWRVEDICFSFLDHILYYSYYLSIMSIIIIVCNFMNIPFYTTFTYFVLTFITICYYYFVRAFDYDDFKAYCFVYYVRLHNYTCNVCIFSYHLFLFCQPTLMRMKIPVPLVLYMTIVFGLHYNFYITLLWHLIVLIILLFLYHYGFIDDILYDALPLARKKREDQAIPGIPDRVLRIVIASYCLYKNIRESPKNSPTTWLRHIIAFLNTYFSATEMVEVCKSIFSLFPTEIEAQSVSDYFHDTSLFDPIEPQSLGFDNCDNFLKTWRSLSDSELVIRATRVLHACIYSALFKSFKVDVTSSNLGIFLPAEKSCKKFASPQDFLLNVFELILQFCKTGVACVQEKSLAPFLISNQSFREWRRDCDLVIDEVMGEPTCDNFNSELMVEKMEALIARSHTIQIEPVHLIEHVRKLSTLRTKILQKYGVSAIRRPPFSVLLVSPPGQGKTTLCHILAKIYQSTVKRLGIHPDLEWDPRKNSYTLNSKDEYMSGYRGSTQWCMFLDDLAREPSNHIKAGLTNFLDLIIEIINPVGIASNQANLEDKGIIPVNPKLVVGTTNTWGIGAVHGAACPAAIHRRFPVVIIPILKDKYKDPLTGTMKKMEKVECDAWDYEVYTVKLYCRGTTASHEHVPVFGPDNLATSAQLSVFLNEKIEQHERSSTAMMDGMMDLPKVTTCPHDILSVFQCPDCEKASKTIPTGDVLDAIHSELIHLQVRATGAIFFDYVGITAPSGTLSDLLSKWMSVKQELSIITIDLSNKRRHNLIATSKPANCTQICMEYHWYVTHYSTYLHLLHKDAYAKGRHNLKLLMDMWTYIFAHVTTARTMDPIFLDYGEYDSDYDSEDELEAQTGPIGYVLGKLVEGGLTPFQVASANGLVALWKVGSKDLFLGGISQLYKSFSFSVASKIHGRVMHDVYQYSLPLHTRQLISAIDYTISASTFAWLAWKLIGSSKLDAETQGNNIWANTDGFNDYFSVPSVAKKGNRDEILASVKKSMIQVVVKGEGVNHSAFAFHLDGTAFVTVGHIFKPGAEKWLCQAQLPKGVGITVPAQTFVLTPDCIRFLDNDLAVFNAVLLPRGSLRKFLPTGAIDKAGRHGLLINPKMEIPGIVDMRSYSETMYRSDFGIDIRGHFMTGIRSDKKPIRGDCGSLIVSQVGEKWVVTGMHCAGSPAASSLAVIVASQLCQDMFEEHKPLIALSEPGDDSQFIGGSPNSGPLGKPYRKGVHCWTPARCEVLGSYPRGITSVSRTEPTAICDRMKAEFQIDPGVGKPLMSAVQDKDGNWLNPYTVATEQQGAVSGLFPISQVMACVDSFYNDMIRDGTDWLKGVRNLNTFESINGVPDNPHINRIVMKTSGGFNFPGKKSKLFTQDEEENWLPKQPLIDAIHHLEQTYALGNRARPVFNGTLKDEPLSYKKIKSGRTRVFTASPVHVTIVERKQYMGVCAAIEDNNFITECAVSMNHLLVWGDILRHITFFGDDRVIAGDYGNYDKGMPPIFILGSFIIMDRLRAIHGTISKMDMLISQGIATDIAFPVVNMNKDLIQFYGGNPSGHPLTSVVNSLANSLFMRFCYRSIGFPLETFVFNVKLITYGDDNVMSSKLDGFNHTAIRDVLADHGVKFTMSDKDAESKPFCHVSEIDFLKRKFITVNDKVVAPLDEKSIFKSLCYWVRKDTIESPQQLAQSYGAARREWCLYGKEHFDKRVAQMDRVLDCPIGEEVKHYFTRQHTLDFEATWDFLFGDPERFVWNEDDNHFTLSDLEALSCDFVPSPAVWEE